MTVARPKAEELLELLDRVRIVPVVVVDDAAVAAPLGAALLTGGLPIAEITFRTPAAGAAIKEMAAIDELIVGAGTVLTPAQVDSAVDAGAQFIVSPGFSTDVVDAARERDVPVITGAATANEIQMALEHGQDVVKLFPAEAVGGLATLKALSAPFPSVRFVPTGGITQHNAGDYLAEAAVLAVGGSWMVDRDLLRCGDIDAVTERCAAAVALSRSVADRRRTS